MMTRTKLQRRVEVRAAEIKAENARLSDLSKKLSSFVLDIKNRSAIYALIKNLPLWKELEKLIGPCEKE